ncbi:PKD domain-containing protein, partial [Chitinophaga qingshengii]
MKRLITFLLLLTGFVLPSAKTIAQTAFMNAPTSVCAGSFATMNGLVWSGSWEVHHMDWSVSPALAATDYEMLYTNDGTGTDEWLNRTPDIDNYPGVTAMTIRLKKVGSYTFTVKLYDSNGNYISASKTIKVEDCSISKCTGTISTMAGFKEDFGVFNDGDKPRKNAIIEGMGSTLSYTFPTKLSPLNIGDDYYVEYWNTQAKPEWVFAYDHTGGVSYPQRGGMLVANSSIKKKAFYQRTINNLCPGSVYNFSAWFMNVNGIEVFNKTCARASDTPPDGYHYAGVTFILTDPVTNTELKRFNTNDVSMNLAYPEWQQYGGSFKIPAGKTSVKLTILNNNPGGCGNDIAIDDIQFTYCSPDLFAYVDGLKDEKRIKDQICGGAPLNLTAYLEPASYFTNPVYQWEMSTVSATGPYSPISNGAMNTGSVSGATTPVLSFTAGALKGDPNVSKVYYFRVNITEKDNVSLGNCAAPSRPVEITVLPQPQISVTGNEICNGQQAHLEVTGGYTSYFWKVDPLVNGTKLDVSPNVTTTYEVVGEKTYGNNKVCRDSNRAQIVVYPKPIVNVTLVTPKTICQGEEAKLEIEKENSKYTISWQYNGVIIPGETGTSITHTPTQVTDLTATPPVRNIYTVIVKNGVCAPQDQAEVIVNSMPKLTPQPDIKQCENGTFTLNGTPPKADQSGVWTYKNNDNQGTTLTNPTAYNATVSGLGLGKTVTLVWTVTNNNLSRCSASNEVVLINMPKPTSAATVDITQCNNKTFDITGTEPAAWETGVWTGPAGVNILEPTKFKTTATLTGTATTQDITLTWTLSNGKCADGKSLVNLHLRPAPKVSATANPVCQTAKQFTVNATVLAGSGAITKYTVKQGTGNPLSGFPNATGSITASGAINVTLPDNTAAGTYDFILTVQNDDNLGCSLDVPFKLRVDAQPDATISGTAAICLGTTVTLSVDASNSTYTKKWTINGTVQSSTGQSLTHTPTAAGTYNYSVTITNLTCSDTKNFTVVVTEVPVAKPGTVLPQCDNGNFTMDATLPADQEGEWTISGSANGAVITTPTDPKTTVTGLEAGKTVTLTWTVRSKNNNNCQNSANITLRNTKSLSESVAGDPIIQCGNNKFQLNGSQPVTADGETGKWSGPANVSFGNATLYNTTATVTGTPPVTVTLTWTISNGVCKDKTSTIDLTVNKVPSVDAAVNASVCNSGTTFDLVTSNQVGIITKYTIKPASTKAMPGFTTQTGAWTSVGTIKVTYPAGTPAGTYNFILTVQDGTNAGCTKDVPFSVIIDANPTVVLTADMTDVCDGATVKLSIDKANLGHTITWTVNGNPIAAANNQTEISVTPAAGTYKYTVTVKNGNCTVSDEKT